MQARECIPKLQPWTAVLQSFPHTRRSAQASQREPLRPQFTSSNHDATHSWRVASPHFTGSGPHVQRDRRSVLVGHNRDDGTLSLEVSTLVDRHARRYDNVAQVVRLWHVATVHKLEAHALELAVPARREHSSQYCNPCTPEGAILGIYHFSIFHFLTTRKDVQPACA